MFGLIKDIEKDYFNIYIGDTTFFSSNAYYHGDQIDEPTQFVARDKEVAEIFLRCTLKDFGQFEYIALKNIIDWLEFEDVVYISFDKEQLKKRKQLKQIYNIKLLMNIIPILALWHKGYSFFDYFVRFEEIFNMNKALDGKIILNTENNPLIEISFDISISSSQKIAHLLSNYIDELNDINKQVKLELKSREYSIITAFIFPKELKAVCEQYLLYFAQFLHDLGINATSNLNEEAGKVLFSVTPTDDIEALDKIREALAVYLNLPNSPIVFDDSFVAMRLQQQIENLQHSQRMAARELQSSEKLIAAQSDMLHEKNLTISQLQSVNEQQQKIIEKISSKSIMMDSLENKEKLYEGLEFVPSEALKKYAGVIFQPMSFFKELGKNMLGKDEFTSLDLDKEVEE